MYQKANLTSLLESAYYKNNDLSGKRVVLRSCLNVSVDDSGNITDDTRLQESLPTILDLAAKSSQLIIVGHMGRPKGVDVKLSFKPLAEYLQPELEKIGKQIYFSHTIEDASMHSGNGTVILLENIRFNEGEESNDEARMVQFAHSLAGLGDIFVNDAFADYRPSASTYYIAKELPSYLGTNFYNEVISLAKFTHPAKPFVGVLGGAKLSEKLDSLKALLESADKVLVGGAMAYTLLKVQGYSIGKSLFEEDKLGVAHEIVEKFGHKLILPVDHIMTHTFEDRGVFDFTKDANIPQTMIGVDIGPKTVKLFKETLAEAGSILTNGPMGVFEWDSTSRGTYEILRAIEENTTAYTLIGGGDSISAVNRFKLTGFDHISTGGGAMLAFVAHTEFPTLDVVICSNNV